MDPSESCDSCIPSSPSSTPFRQSHCRQLVSSNSSPFRLSFRPNSLRHNHLRRKDILFATRHIVNSFFIFFFAAFDFPDDLSSGIETPQTEPESLVSDSGDEGDRTPDPLLAKQVLSQLSYTPMSGWWVWLDSNQRPPPYQDGALTD